jgi:4-phosphopantoate--beta-alanine ligase
LVPLEDGDRTIALKKFGKSVITFDLNPMSRTAQTADITIVDNIIRGIRLLIDTCRKLSRGNIEEKPKFDNKKNLKKSILVIRKNLRQMANV